MHEHEYAPSALQIVKVYVTDMSSRLWTALRLALFHVVFSSSLFNLAVVADNDTNPISTPSGVYNSSDTPASFPWNTYNYCNAPHVNAKHYEFPNNVSGSKLVYANTMIRHHKVFEYAMI